SNSRTINVARSDNSLVSYQAVDQILPESRHTVPDTFSVRYIINKRERKKDWDVKVKIRKRNT
ncbi:MAG: hypothetical protein ACKOCH_27295, partial [Bacteroidota bacterium]